ncbi:MAG TPA: DUF4185 domain-containing protein [Fimbriimonas sp.]
MPLLAALILVMNLAPADTFVPVRTVKVSQVTGDFDRERKLPTLNLAESRYGVRGIDLGASFEHDGKLVFLFGDTWPVGRHTPDRPIDGDAIAVSSDTNGEDGLHLSFLTADDGKYLAVQIPGVSLKGFEVPNGGFSHGGAMYGFYTTDATWLPNEFFMGRSILGRSTDGKRWEFVRDVSKDKFINISPWAVDASKVAGLPDSKGKGLLMWASGRRYRASDPFLAYTPLDRIHEGSAMRYWAGPDKWSDSEGEAKPLFAHPHIGEISVGWCEPLKTWMMLYNSGEPRGIHMRTAPNPWGPWSEPKIVFNPDDGYGRFMHVSWKDRKVDEVHDPGRENEYGGEYGPYMIPRFFRKTSGGATIYYLLSTWNPYQVVLMRTDLERKPAPVGR